MYVKKSINLSVVLSLKYAAVPFSEEMFRFFLLNCENWPVRVKKNTYIFSYVSRVHVYVYRNIGKCKKCFILFMDAGKKI